MNLENFSNYLQNPALLYQLNYDELKNLVLEYPYSANLRLLLLVKSRMESDERWKDYLAKAASHTIDRAFLYDLVKSSEKPAPIEALELGEEYLELKSLSELDALQRESQQEYVEQDRPLNMTATNALDFDLVPTEVKETENKAVEDLPVFRSSPPAPRPSNPQSLDLQAFGYMLEQIGLLPSPKPLPKEQFRDWENRPNELDRSEISRRIKQTRLRQLRKKKKDTSGDKALKKKPVKQIARQSLVEHPDLASETLARLLVEQERYSKAIKMYEQLSLKNPEKSAFFAGIIENLKQKI